MSIKSSIRDLLPTGVRRIFKRAGDYLDPIPVTRRFPGAIATLDSIRRRGFNPSTIIDVGAYVGCWTIMAKGVFPTAHVLMIEPQESKYQRLVTVCQQYSESVELAQVLLGPRDGLEVDFVEMETGSSVFEERSYFDRVRLQKTTTTLDTLLKNKGWARVDLLKLDVQGYELEVLKGASHLLPHCELVLLEVSLVPINKGAPLATDVLAFMTVKGFALYDICSVDIRRRDGVLWATDLMFINQSSKLLPVPELTSENW